MHPIEEFWSLCAQAEIAYNHPDSCGTPALQSFGLRILKLTEEHPELHASFERAFCELWQRPQAGPFELIGFCMHTLRWGSVREFMERELREAEARQDWRVVPLARHIVEAFNDDWEDRDLYPHYDTA